MRRSCCHAEASYYQIKVHQSSVVTNQEPLLKSDSENRVMSTYVQFLRFFRSVWIHWILTFISLDWARDSLLWDVQIKVDVLILFLENLSTYSSNFQKLLSVLNTLLIFNIVELSVDQSINLFESQGLIISFPSSCACSPTQPRVSQLIIQVRFPYATFNLACLNYQTQVS